jgi:hypothetical protein
LLVVEGRLAILVVHGGVLQHSPEFAGGGVDDADV